MAALFCGGLATAGTAVALAPDEAAPPPEELAPPPPTSPPPATLDDPEPGPTSTTITVPALPAPKSKPAPAKKQAVTAPGAGKKVERRSVRRAREPDRRRFTSSEEPSVQPEQATQPKPKPKPKTKPKPTRKQAHRAKPAPVAAAPAPRYPAVVRDSTPVSSVLGAQFAPETVATSATDPSVVYLLIGLALAGSLILGVAGAAPWLAWYWPEIFGPVTRGRTDLSLFGAFLVAGGILVWAIVPF